MSRKDDLAMAIANALTRKLLGILVWAVIFLSVINFFQGAEFKQGPGFIGWVKMGQPHSQIEKREGITRQITTQRYWAAGIALSASGAK